MTPDHGVIPAQQCGLGTPGPRFGAQRNVSLVCQAVVVASSDHANHGSTQSFALGWTHSHMVGPVFDEETRDQTRGGPNHSLLFFSL
jgi:hypothetical protein